MRNLGSGIRGNFVTRYFTRLLSEYLSDQFKRMLYVSSVLGAIARSDYPDLEVIKRMNSGLRLSRRATSLMFPIYIGNILWKDIRGEVVSLEIGGIRMSELQVDKLAETDLWRASVFFAKHAPIWINYGTPNLMAGDVHDAFVLLASPA